MKSFVCVVTKRSEIVPTEESAANQQTKGFGLSSKFSADASLDMLAKSCRISRREFTSPTASFSLLVISSHSSLLPKKNHKESIARISSTSLCTSTLLYFTSSCARGRNSITSSLDLDVNGCEVRLKTRVCLLSCITIDLFTNSEYQWNERTQIQLGKSFKKTFHGLSHIVRSYQPGADRRRLTVKWELLACRKWLLNLSRIIKLHNSPGSAIKVPQTLPHCDEIASGMWHRNSWRSH